jgi:hypothetical protein
MPLDDVPIEQAYLIVSFDVPAHMPPGPIAFVLKRLEDDPRNFGVVDWEPSIPAAEMYLHELLLRHRGWERMSHAQDDDGEDEA